MKYTVETSRKRPPKIAKTEWSLMGGGRLLESNHGALFPRRGWECFGVLDKWSLMGGGCFLEVVAHGVSTVV